MVKYIVSLGGDSGHAAKIPIGKDFLLQYHSYTIHSH